MNKKILFLFFGLIFSLFSSTLSFAKPAYSLNSKEVLGHYVYPKQKSDSSVAEVYKNKIGVLKVNFFDLDINLEVHESKGGVLVFSSGNIEPQEQCDNPGCSDLVRVYGVIYPKLSKNGKYTPVLKYTVEENFPHPEDDMQPLGIQTSTIRLIKR